MKKTYDIILNLSDENSIIEFSIYLKKYIFCHHQIIELMKIYHWCCNKKPNSFLAIKVIKEEIHYYVLFDDD